MADTQIQHGSRGYYATVKNNGVDLRLHQRDFVDFEKLHATWRGINLTKEEWFDLIAASLVVTACVEEYQRGSSNPAKPPKEPSLFVPLGNQGVHAVVNVYNSVLLIQIRVYTRSFYDPDKLFPTKKGVALKTEEWEVLRSHMNELSAALN